MEQNTKLQKAALVVAKCLEIAHWIGVIVMAALFVCSLIAKDQFYRLIDQGSLLYAPTLTTYGFDIQIVDAAGNISFAALTLFFIETAIVLSLMAMVFRNIRLTIKTLCGTNPHTRRTTPFQPDVVRMLREIGIFFLSVSGIALIFSTAAMLILGPEAAEISINLDSLIMGLFVLCLTQVFSYGMGLEADVDGLV